jgi:hypothetical protein
VGMVKWQLPYVLVAVAPGMTLGLVGGVAHLAERGAAPVSGITAEPMDFPRLKLNRERIAATPIVREPASHAEPPTVVTTAASLAAPDPLDASPLAPRAVEVVPPVPRAVEVALPEPPAVKVMLPLPKPKLARKSSESSLRPMGLPQAAFTPPSAPVARPKPDEKPRSREESGESNFAAELGVPGNGGGR